MTAKGLVFPSWKSHDSAFLHERVAKFCWVGTQIALCPSCTTACLVCLCLSLVVVISLRSRSPEVKARFLLHALQVAPHTQIKRQHYRKYQTLQSLDSCAHVIKVLVSTLCPQLTRSTLLTFQWLKSEASTPVGFWFMLSKICQTSLSRQ